VILVGHWFPARGSAAGGVRSRANSRFKGPRQRTPARRSGSRLQRERAWVCSHTWRS